jgi:hypothetical protein
VQNIPTSPARFHRPSSPASLEEAEFRMFQASSAFVSACQEATVAMHALTAKIRAMEKKVEPIKGSKAKA